MTDRSSRMIFSFDDRGDGSGGFGVLDEGENCVTLPPPFGEGSVTSIPGRSDLGMVFVRHRRSAKAVRVDTTTPEPSLKLGFALRARSCATWLDGDSRRMPVATGSLCISSPTAKICFEDSSEDEFDFATLSAGAACIGELEEEFGAASAPDFGRLVREPGGEPSLIVRSFDPAARGIVAQIEKCPYCGAARRLFVEGAILELLAVSLRRLLRIEEAVAPRGAIAPRGERSVREAAEILESRLTRPPSIGELAAELGMSQSTLKRNFKRVHGEAVHEFVVGRRMDVARSRLESGEFSVKEAAYLAGYRSMSYFSKEFARRYGRAPGGGSRRSLP